MDNTTPVTPFVIADAYRIGQSDGFKAGLAVGIVTVLLVKAAARKRGRRWFNVQKNEK